MASDQLTKALALRFLSQVPTLPIVPGVFHLTLVTNPGVAFGLFRGYGLPLVLVTLVILLGLIRTFTQKEVAGGIPLISLGLLIGGALGNLIDRLCFGSVIDFLDFRIWPVFNLADSCITVGAVLLGLSLIRRHGRAG